MPRSRLAKNATRITLVLLALALLLASVQFLVNALVYPRESAFPGGIPGFVELLVKFQLPEAGVWLLTLYALFSFTPQFAKQTKRINIAWALYWLVAVIASSLIQSGLVSLYRMVIRSPESKQLLDLIRADHGSALAPFLFETGRHLRQSVVMSLLGVGVLLADTYRRESEQERLYNAELSMQLARARIEALNARLNPHFLFNALHTVSALVHCNPDRAIRGISLLGEVLRASLGRSEHQFVSFAEEIGFARDYVSLESMRFEGRMSCEWRIDPAAEPAQVPPFLLQPLIENAVKYGVDTSPGQTKINITVQVQDAHLLIEITHLCSVIGPRHSARDGLQIGINNLRMRLDALYGQQHWLLEQRFEAGCSETVLLIPSGRPKNAVDRLANSYRA